MNFEKIIVVKDRLKLVEHLNNAEPHFKGRLYSRDLTNNTVLFPLYKNYFGLKAYLLLTCFDILGQPDEWLDFNNWLNCKKIKVKDEKNRVFQNIHFKDNPESYIADVLKEYNNIYGVKNSFYSFVNNVISQENRNKLFKSISNTERIREYKVNKDGTHRMPAGKTIEIDNVRKLKFLFQLRNSFTHKGIAYGASEGAIFDINQTYKTRDGRQLHYEIGIHTEKINGKTIIWKVNKWPYVLSEILYETIDS